MKPFWQTLYRDKATQARDLDDELKDIAPRALALSGYTRVEVRRLDDQPRVYIGGSFLTMKDAAKLRDWLDEVLGE